jgi:hypothetical protein
VAIVESLDDAAEYIRLLDERAKMTIEWNKLDQSWFVTLYGRKDEGFLDVYYTVSKVPLC